MREWLVASLRVLIRVEADAREKLGRLGILSDKALELLGLQLFVSGLSGIDIDEALTAYVGSNTRLAAS